ncbi:FecR family protein [Undibacterium sp. SXout20W]|uniref:FecR family protein n=1 Tax=Undibacterium sp. SXout20W TaxID=3413051 RepID=UPI003BF0E062
MNNAELIEAMASEWMIRREKETWTYKEQIELDSWLNLDIAHRLAFWRLEAAWERTNQIKSLKAETFEMADFAISPKSKKSYIWKNISLQALTLCGFIAMLVSGLWLWQHDEPKIEQYSVAIGSRKTVLLKDGSRLTLNANTTLRSRMSNDQRQIWLDKGEAYFDVTHELNRPFIIKAGKSVITDIGTQFIVRNENGTVKINVISGQVKVVPNEAEQEAKQSPQFLGRNDEMILDDNSFVRRTNTDTDTEALLNLQKGIINLQGQPLSKIVSEFNRYNRRQFVLDKSVTNLRLDGSLDINNIDGLVLCMNKTLGLKVHINGDLIEVSK